MQRNCIIPSFRSKFWHSHWIRRSRYGTDILAIGAEPRYPQSYSATTTSILWPREQNGTRSLSKASIGRVCTRPARTRATKEKMARCSQERLCWHGPDCKWCDPSCPRQRRLETIHSQAAVACTCRSIAKALSQVKSSQVTYIDTYCTALETQTCKRGRRLLQGLKNTTRAAVLFHNSWQGHFVGELV